MADKNTYLRYKRDQRHLVYWIANTSNRLIKSGASKDSLAVNTTGEVSLVALQSMTHLIAQHVKPIPNTIFRLFQSIIEARKQTHAMFMSIVASNPDPEIERNNDSHKHWIDGMTEAFNGLGGEAWLSEQKDYPAADEDEEEIIFANKFSTLSLDVPTGENDEDETEDEDTENGEQPSSSASAPSKKRKPAKKGKKGKRGRKSKAKAKAESPTPTATVAEIPLESYRIIEDETGLVTDYLMAVYSFAHLWMDLRHYLQGLWREVAYEGLNGAVAATLSNIALAVIKDSEAKIFVDFPGHESFETIVQTITRGDPDLAQGMFKMEVHRTDAEGHVEMAASAELDVREELLIHAYQDLVDFVVDFQKTRSGKPTKNTAKCIQNWDPEFDLEKATKEQRLKWRRDYTINWLYDLVNVYSSFMVQRKTVRGQDISLESIDWSIHGPCTEYRRLFGINEFAGVVTQFAMQKPGTDIRKKVLPHHVFQLQAIVDSLTVSRGWSIHTLLGHCLGSPAPDFRPRRDVDQFTDQEMESPDAGYNEVVELLSLCFGRDAMLHGDPRRHEQLDGVLHELRDDFKDWLGESKYMHGLKGIPPSRFSHVNANGLWEYSPYLCGAGLMEALELALGMGLVLWDRVLEPMCIIHLHNMLVKTGYITSPVGLYTSFATLLGDSFFVNGEPPTAHFDKALQERACPPKSWRSTLKLRALKRKAARNSEDLHSLLDSSTNRFFRAKSFLHLYRTADWVPDRIPDEEIPLPSALGCFRLVKAKRVVDCVSGRVSIEESDLIRRARELGMDDDHILQFTSRLTTRVDGRPIDPRILATILANTPEGPVTEWTSEKSKYDTVQYLEALRVDIMGEICGETRPLAAVNYLTVLVRFNLLFMQIEAELRRRRNPSWVQAYEKHSASRREKRLSITLLALKGFDEELLEVIAKEFENPRAGFMPHVYWGNLHTLISMAREDDNPLGPDNCVVM